MRGNFLSNFQMEVTKKKKKAKKKLKHKSIKLSI